MMKDVKDESRAEDQASAQFQSIAELVAKLNTANENDNYKEQDEVRDRISEDPLSVEVRSDWHYPGKGSDVGGEFKILLCTGGPAVRIIGELDENNEPDSVHLEYQDWGTPWTKYELDSEQEETLLEYCRQFYYAE